LTGQSHMGSGASIPDNEEEARAQGYTDRQIENYKTSVIALAQENARRALELHKTSLNTSREGDKKAEDKSDGPGETLA